MKKCECGAEIQDKYAMCFTCSNTAKSNKAKEAKTADSDKYLKVLQQINWNLGMISKCIQQMLPENKLQQVKKEMKK